MKMILSITGIVVLGFFLLTTAGISPAVGQSNKLGEDERPVMVASETPSYGTEDFIVASSVTPSYGSEDFIVASETASFGAEDWVLASEAVSFGAEDWAEGMEYSDAVATGTLPERPPEKLNLDNYYPD